MIASLALTASSASNLTYSAVTKQKQDNKILVVKQKQINLTDIGAGVTMGRLTRKGSLILNYENEKSIASVQSVNPE